MADPSPSTSIEERLAALEEELARLRERRRSISIVCFSGEYDRLYAAFTIATGASSMELRVEMFFTFWGAHALCNALGAPCYDSWLQRLFGWMMPGKISRLPLSRMNFWGLGPRLMRRMMRRKGVEDLEALIATARRMGVTFHICDTSAQMLGLSVCTDAGASHAGVATFLAKSLEGNLVLFI